jgi:hypothetical protein
MSLLAELNAARLGYRAAVLRAHESLRRQEREFTGLCERLDRAQRDLRAAGYLREPRPAVPAEPGGPEPRRWNRVVERAQLKIARQLGRRRGGPSSGVPAGHAGRRALRQGGR